MTCEQTRDLLEAHLDGGLEPDMRDQVDGHLAQCPACAARFQRFQALLVQAQALPRSIEPPRNLWPGIAARLRDRPAAPLSARRRSARVVQMRTWWLAAAAAVLVAASSGLTAWFLRSDRALVGRAAVAPNLPNTLVALERDYTGAVAEIERVLLTNRGTMAPEAVAAVERSLRVLDDAIQESRAAVARSPENQQLSRLLWAAYEQKLDLLRRATRIAGEL
ncbi:MAG TPA: zf-HC2 domain-containing protein [Gemmatimonadales bacterium]